MKQYKLFSYYSDDVSQGMNQSVKDALDEANKWIKKHKNKYESRIIDISYPEYQDNNDSLEYNCHILVEYYDKILKKYNED